MRDQRLRTIWHNLRAYGRRSPMTTSLLVLNSAVFLGYQRAHVTVGHLLAQGGVLSADVGGLHPGNWWRYPMSVVLSGGWWDYGFNLAALAALGDWLEPLGRWWQYGMLYALAGLGGSIAYALFGGPHGIAAGASGAIFGLLGALLTAARHQPNTQAVRRAVGLTVALNLPLNFLSGIAWQAHAAGFVIGLVGGWLLDYGRAADACGAMDLAARTSVAHEGGGPFML